MSHELEEKLRANWNNPALRIPDSKLLREQAVLGLTDPYYFAHEILQLSKDEIPAPETEARPLYEWLDRPRPPIPAKQIWLDFICQPRLTRKTYTIGAWLTQQIVREPNLRIIIDGQERQAAGDTVKLIREWLELPELVRLYGVFASDDWGKFEFTVAQRDRALRDPTVRALGLDNSEQGKRCDLRWWDDLVGKSNNNPEGITKVEEHISAGMPIIKPGGRGLYSCTRWNVIDPATDGYTARGNMGILRHVRDNTGFWHAPPPRGYFSAWAEPGDEVFYPHAKPGELLYPSILTKEFLEGQAAIMSHGEFAAQYKNNPLASLDRPFDANDIRYFDPFVDGERNPCRVGAIPYVGVDPASGKAKTATKDDTAFCVIEVKWEGPSDFTVYVLEWNGGRWNDTRIMDQVFLYLNDYKPRRIIPEVNIGGEFIVGPWKRKARELGIHLPLEEETASLHGTGKKDALIENTLGTLYRQGKIYHARKLKNSKAEDQLLRWVPGGAAHDDYPNVLAWTVFWATKKRMQAIGGSQPRRVVGLGSPGRYASTGV